MEMRNHDSQVKRMTFEFWAIRSGLAHHSRRRATIPREINLRWEMPVFIHLKEELVPSVHKKLLKSKFAMMCRTRQMTLLLEVICRVPHVTANTVKQDAVLSQLHSGVSSYVTFNQWELNKMCLSLYFVLSAGWNSVFSHREDNSDSWLALTLWKQADCYLVSQSVI